ncbi:LOW QUALITY PROTEIN: hypothetical protein U9M48_034664, partial [Paspalum notatum var. saurae]
MGSQDHYIKIDDRKCPIFEENMESTIGKTLKPFFPKPKQQKVQSYLQAAAGMQQAVKNLAVIYVNPSEQWEVLPSKMNNVFGAICLKLHYCTNGTMCTFVIPIEIEVHTRIYYDSSGLVAVTFEPMSTCDESGSIFSLSLRNDGPKLLRVVGVTEDDRNGPMIFQVKYLNGLILFLDTVTDIALVRYTSSVPEGVSFDSCNIVVEANITLGCSIIIPCKDLVCASISYTNNAIVAEFDGRIILSLCGHPSLEHAAMQLIVNSEETIDQCKAVTDVCELIFSSKSPEINSTETRFGFSLSDAAITVANVGPLETALLGPVLFRPSNSCMWSIMKQPVRRGVVEMLPLCAYGGQQSIILLEESKPAWKLEFNLGSNVQNKSTMANQEVPSSSCSQQLTKEIHVKNSGDIHLQVAKVKISGADCGVDGFTVDNCKGFSLAPTDFSSAMVQRDLELVMTTGIFPIPMTANIPACMLNQCRKPYLISAHWKLLVFFFGALTLLVLVFVRYAPHSLTMGSQDHYIKIDDRKCMESTIGKTLKASFLNPSSKKYRTIKGQKRTEEALAEKYPASVVDSSQSTDDRNNSDGKLHTTSSLPMSLANLVEDRDSREAPQASENLTIRIARDKGRRRKRKVGGAGLAGKFELAATVGSGNSTPSSPLLQSSTPEQGWSFSGTPSELKHENKVDAGFDVEATTSSTRTNQNLVTGRQGAASLALSLTWYHITFNSCPKHLLMALTTIICIFPNCPTFSCSWLQSEERQGCEER